MIVSSIKNRVRFSDENIKNKEIVEKIENSLKDLKGIESTRITKEIGTLLINYDEEKIELSNITDVLKEYIDITEQIKELEMQTRSYVDGALGMVKKGIGMGKGNCKGKEKGRGGNGESLVGMVSDNWTGNGIIKTAVYGVLGLKGYNKGKSMMQGKGRGKNK